jgi:penicillin G amidase
MQPNIACSRLRIATQAVAIIALLTAPAFAREVAVPTETLRVSGLRAPVEIRVDRWGVPHLYAKSEHDVFFAQGFNAARDRLFQIDLWRRRGLGQLAEVFGAEFADQDRAARLFLYRGDMDREWRIYSSRNSREAEPITQRFVEGINAYIDWLQSNPARMPWEFTFLKYQPAKWTADDVIRIRSHGLTRNLNSEVARANTLCKAKDVDADQMRFGLSNDWKAQIPVGLAPCLPTELLKVFQLATQGVRVTKAAVTATQASVTVEPVQLAALEENPPEGSNSWVIGRAKSATGRPIMSNDPHRAYSAPSLRYLVHLSAPGLDVIGAGEPALPGISLGHNGTIAFGLTIFNIDQEDLYVYELNPVDATQYKYKDGWESFRVVKFYAPRARGLCGFGKGPRLCSALRLAGARHEPLFWLLGIHACQGL